MKVLFAVSDENISNSIIKRYQQIYKEIISSKNVYYFNAILKELQKDKSYDRVVISEDLEPFTNNNFDTIDNFIFDKLDTISDEASNNEGEDIPIILIATDRRTKNDNLLVKLFGIGVYSTLIGQDRSIDQICKLINKPRTKKEAKVYYQIDSNEVEYKAESESDVSELEIQNILNHYKRLGKNEDRYVESFNSIAAQYTDAQLKIIIKFLPLNVKAVLEENCPRYQQLVAFSGTNKKVKNLYETAKIKKRDNSGIKVESIIKNANEKRLTKPVIIPSTVSTKNVKKAGKTYTDLKNQNDNNIDIKSQQDNKKVEVDNVLDTIPDVIEENNVVETKKRRGRPKKNIEDNKIVEEPKKETSEPEVKKRRGRPKKIQEENIINEESKEVNLFGLDEDEENENVLPGFSELDLEEEVQNNDNQEYEDEEYENEEYENEEYEDEEVNQVSEPNRMEDRQEKQTRRSAYDELIDNPVSAFAPSSDNLLTKDKKVVAFVGTSKNGTSFLVNNVAELLSSQGIRTAILDLTKNKNAYYIYTKNEENLRKVAFNCIKKLTQGVAQGIKVNKSLDVYTCLPGEEEEYEGQSEAIMQTLLKNYALILIDCDFSTEYEYLRKAQEIYLVQSMDVLTIQPLTAYLRDLKAKNVLSQEKLRVVINKSMRVRSITERTIIGGMAFYNDPAMSFMTELFNREKIKYTVIPFDVQVYSKYLEGLVNCNISLNGYSKDFLSSLKRLASMVYPLINGKIKNNYDSSFSNDMNNTLDKMKGIY